MKELGPLFTGDVANVSAGEDADKAGATYRTYFERASSYTLTNYGGTKFRGFRHRPDEIELDLTALLPLELKARFDVVLNHTTLEHIYDVHGAFRNLCAMSRDIVIVVVPFAQVQHENEGYLDYWRFTPTCLRRMFEGQGMTVVYEAANDGFNTSVYLLFVASRKPDAWSDKMPSFSPLKAVAGGVGGEPTFRELVSLLGRRLRRCLH